MKARKLSTRAHCDPNRRSGEVVPAVGNEGIASPRISPDL